MSSGYAPASAGLKYVDRYVGAVGAMLPAARRKDIEAEIRANLLDEIEGATGEGGFPGGATEQTVLEVLRRYPAPAEMAGRYGAVQSLIGPALYNSYMTVLKLVLAVVVTINVITLLLRIMAGQTSFAIFEALGGILSSAFFAGGVVTLIFALIERSPEAVQGIAEENEGKSWEPTKLPEITDHTRAKPGDVVGDIFSSLLAILFLNVFVSSDGSMPIFLGEWVETPFFSELFMTFVPWLTAFCAVELLICLVVLAQGRWTTWSRIVLVASLVGSVAVSAYMLSAGDLAANAMWEWAVRLGVGVAILITLYQIGGHVWAMIQGGRERGGGVSAVVT